MKKIIYTIIVALFSINLSAQYFTMDFFVLNDGTESDRSSLTYQTGGRQTFRDAGDDGDDREGS